MKLLILVLRLSKLVSYLVIAGGAGGGGEEGGGGGAGGFREYKSPVTPYTASPLNGNPGGTSVTLTATSYPITVGAGGTGQTSDSGNPGGFWLAGNSANT